MALSEVALPIAFAGGVETKLDSKTVPTTRLLDLQNGVFTKGTTIAKRFGYTAFSKSLDIGGEYEAPRALAARGDELVMLTATDLYSYRESSETWSRVGPAQSTTHIERAVAATGTDQSMPDAATADGVRVLAWEDSRGGIWWSVVEVASGRILRAAEQLDPGGICPRVVHVADRIHVYYVNAPGGQILAAIVDPSGYLAPVVPVLVTGDLNPLFPSFDACAFPATSSSAMAWNIVGGFRVALVDVAGAIAASPAPGTYVAGAEGPIAVCQSTATTLYGATGCVGVALPDSNSGTVTGYIFGPSTFVGYDAFADVLSGGATRIAATMIDDAANLDARMVVWAENLGATARDSRVSCGSVTVNSGVGPSADVRGHGLASCGFGDDSGACVVLVHAVPFFPYAACVRMADITTAPTFTCVGRLLVGSSDGLPVRTHLAGVEQDADDPRLWAWPGLARELVNAAPRTASFTETGIRIVSIDFDDADAFQNVTFGRDLVIAGACPLRYDGDTCAELGFHTAPDGDITAIAAGAGLPPPGPPPASGSMAAGTYLYFAAYEEVDALGEVHYGPMSVGTLVTLVTGDNRVTITGPMYRLTSKRRVRLGIYRTEVNDTSEETPDAYRVTSLDPSATGYNGYVLNDPTTDLWTFTDGLSDLDLLTRERAYTNVGVLSNDPIGLGHIVTSGKGRLFFTAPEDGNLVRFTKQQRSGVGSEVCADLAIPVDPYGGDVTALAVLDDTVIVFKAGAIYGFTGPGPLDNPNAAPQVAFSPAQLITSDVGCSAPRSIAVTPQGVMFQTARGVYLLDRGRSVSYIGAPVEVYNAVPIVRATTLPGRTQILFLTEQTGGRSLLYDYDRQQWSTFTNHDGKDAAVVRGVYHYLRASSVDERVFREDLTGYTDAGREVTLLLVTAWIKLAGYIQGWQKIWFAHFIGEWLSSHTLRVRIGIDYQRGFDAPYDLDVDVNQDPADFGEDSFGSGDFGGDGDTVYQRRIHVGQKGQAVRFEISDVASTGTLGASFELSELLLTGGSMRPSAKFSSSRTS